ncbi:MAG TPA: OmpP1/FadL family transporter [Synergistales bacterium]|nr:OmpP1/FadL family transporter [Synergistales bacterium]HPK42916.1 OmpP1/FadL family transporter [Synergistales bacterium]
MRRPVLILVIATAVTVLACGTALGAGFALYDWSARGNALGGAMTGRADDPSALAFNPAGITQIPGSSMMAGLTFIMPGGTLTEVGGDSVGMIDHTFIPPHFYYTRQLNDRLWFGVGLMTRFGLGTDFPPDWYGRYNSYYANIQSVSLNPNLAWKVNDRLSLSVGVEALWFEYGARRKVPPSQQVPMETDFRLLGDDIGYGWNVGLHYRLDEATRIGLHYRSQVNLTISGTADFLGSRDAWGDLTLPEMFMFGISRQVTPKLNVEVGAVYTGWSSYDSLQINVEGLPPNIVEKNWKNVWRYQLGFEYKYSPEWTWRFGYTYDQEPSPDATVDFQAPMSDRQLFSIGFGYTKNDRTLDFAYTYLLADDRTIAARLGDGIPQTRTSNVDAHIFVISYSVRF